MKHLEGLNEAQKQAVMHSEGPLLIVAGAGAGKTKTITHRIVQLISAGAAPQSILAVTFTNKAAGEMRERVGNLLGMGELSAYSTRGPLITTFHSLGARLLREFAEEAGIPPAFIVWDRDDSSRALKKILKETGYEDRFPPRQILSAISRAKGDGETPDDYLADHSAYKKTVGEAWKAYDALREKEGALDFTDLLTRTVELLSVRADVRGKLQARWQYLTIDEYQDTNRAQFEIARLLAGEKKNICAVGDMDQCLVAGTQVTLPNGTTKSIETLQMGDTVLSNYGSGRMRPARITRVLRKKFSGELVSITTKTGKQLVSTPEHVHFAGYKTGKVPQMYFTYLMHKQGKGWRLGVSQMYTKGQRLPMAGYVQRSNHEHSDGVWIIGTHSSPIDARVMEYTLSLKYGIPTLPFIARKGISTNGYVHDQKVIDGVFASFDTESAAKKLLQDYKLSAGHAHHRPQSKNSSRRNIRTTLCADWRGESPMHRVAIIGNDTEGRAALERLGFSVRPAKSTSASWRFETVRKDISEVRSIIARIRSAFPDAIVIETARLGGKKGNIRDGNSLPCIPAACIRPGMAMFDEESGYDIVDAVRTIPANNIEVYDLDIERTHNFIANGVVTHNCIYSWNGADIGNLMSFERQFSGTKIILLEENYRSTQTIITAANGVISKNKNRYDKHLNTNNPTGEAISLFAGESERDEAFYIAREARALLGSGIKPSEVAVLFRQNFQSRSLEEAFIAEGVPYRVLGVRFFDRAEVKDVLSYIRAARNPASSVDFSRAAAAPSRGIGATTLEKYFAGMPLAAAAQKKLDAFRALLRRIRDATETMPASQAVHFALRESGLETLLNADDEGKERLANVYELIAHATRFDALPAPDGIALLLEDAALMGEQDALQKREEAVSLMTIHASKGLEFDAVFVTGLEHGLFPQERDGDDRDTEEERRLFYVALTRARKYLYLTLAGSRLKYGTRERTIPSGFLEDIDQRLISFAESQERLPTIQLL